MNIDDLTILKKASKEIEKREGQAKARYSNNTTNDTERLSAQAYELFSQGKTPVQVAIELNLRELQVTKYYREYWKLKGLYKLNLVYEEIKDDIAYLVKLHRLTKAAGMSTEHVVNLLEIANNDLQSVEQRCEKLQRSVDYLESKSLDASINLEDLKTQIKNANQMLDACRLSCQKEISKMLQLHRQNIRLDALLRQYKNSNEEYLKIKYTAKQAVKSALSDSRQLLKFALLSLIVSLRADPIKFNFLIHGMPPPLMMSKSTIIDYHVKPFSHYSNQNTYAVTLIELLMNEAASLYEKMVKDFTNQTMTNAAADSSAKLFPFMRYSDGQTDHTQALLAYRHITQTLMYDR